MKLLRGRTERPAEHGTAARRDGLDRPAVVYDDLKSRIHRQLIERIDLSKLDTLPRDHVQQQIRRIVEDMLAGGRHT